MKINIYWEDLSFHKRQQLIKEGVFKEGLEDSPLFQFDVKDEKENEKEKSSIAEYTISRFVDENGKAIIRKTAEGFSALEILGLLHWGMQDILDQIHGETEPPVIVKRKRIL